MEAGAHSLQIRENGAVVAEGQVTVVAGQDQTVAVNRAVALGGPMIPGNAQAQTQSGSLRPGDEQSAEGKYIDRYQFQWTVGSQVQVLVDSADFDTYLTVISPSGMAQENDDREPGVSLNSGLTVNPHENGSWSVLVSSYSAYSTGNYTLTVRGP
jgi:hypothetical protein